ncbi:uncharacterized protein LOC142977751 [Anticarsia gemmatalis]|uniref:uncharacterized protein LOC142977751 n=2 Tax=Anticarsia gemmatalis TaxID=129554 RepID=UPI003F75C2C0
MASKLLKCSSCNIVINEILAFVSNKIDVMNEESISQICVSAFSDEDIHSAKILLCESLPTEKRKKIRKRDGKKIREIDDIICMLRESDPEILPVFVARDLHKLPPVLFDHVDVTRILKDLTRMQQEMNQIKEQYVTKDDLDTVKSDLENLKKASIVNNFGSTPRNVNVKRGGFLLLDSHDDYCSGPRGLTYVGAEHDTPCTEPSEVRADTNYRDIAQTFSKSEGVQKNCGETNVMGETSSRLTAVGGSSEPMTHTQSAAIVATSEVGHTAVSSVNDDVRDKNKSLADIVRDGEWKMPKEDKEWTLVQRRRLQNRFVAKRGKAVLNPEASFKAAVTSIPIYIYNIAKGVPECDILSYIASKTDVTVHLEKMHMKTPKSYDAYKVLVPKHKLETFLNDEFWPEGVAYRRFVDFKIRSNGITSGEKFVRV